LQGKLINAPSGSQVQLITRGVKPAMAHPGRAPAVGVAVRAAAAWGLVRVAASEVPQVGWAMTDIDPAISDPSGYVGFPDVFGTAVAGGRIAAPRMIGASPLEKAVAERAPGGGLWGKVVVVGGLGGMLSHRYTTLERVHMCRRGAHSRVHVQQVRLCVLLVGRLFVVLSPIIASGRLRGYTSNVMLNI
jgi:hypothetical protein